MPLLTDPKTAGIEAFRAGQPTSTSGYADGSSQKLSWLDGWTQEQIAQRADVGQATSDQVMSG
ncbi:hypothetical protein [Aureimonas ureilytica]|uniref:hypothetical protein n=1 Tax=Aureimonas ureilytica TaxID=401562 RepID=UPI00036CB414|nr:hypothetical protein [Aureimonas ureilytica]